jgi:hypothetical protein
VTLKKSTSPLYHPYWVRIAQNNTPEISTVGFIDVIGTYVYVMQQDAPYRDKIPTGAHIGLRSLSPPLEFYHNVLLADVYDTLLL